MSHSHSTHPALMSDLSWSLAQPIDDDACDGVMDVPVVSARMSDDELETLFREQWGLPADAVGQDDDVPVHKRVVLRDDLTDEDEYTHDEWAMVRVLRSLCRDAVKKAATLRKRAFSIKFLFVNGTLEPKHGWSFHVLCEALQTRPWVIQTLVQHLWFRRSMVIERLPFLADPLPEAVQSEAIFCAWEPGAMVVSQIWNTPGVLLDSAREASVLPPQAFDRTVATLAEAGLVGVSTDRVWVSSRSERFIRPGQRVSWSASFHGD